jgi:hypothetical protein
MKLLSKKIQQHFNGFLQTPSLWSGNHIFNLRQFKLEQKSIAISENINEKIRLGKYIERFVSFQLKQKKEIHIISENIQIQQGKITLGELDFLLLKNHKPIHLEVVYKFYLYDESVGNTEIEHFIGPNRKDSLVEKLNKLQQKQLPLLYTNECKTYLKNIRLNVSEIEQQVYFKAQLFVPFSNSKLKLSILNQNCIVGFYLNQKELKQFRNCKFYIPSKKDWLTIPHSNVDWIPFNLFKLRIEPFFDRQFSPLIWIKNPKGTINKAFLIWW